MRDVWNLSQIPHIPLTSPLLLLGYPQWNHFVIRYVRVILVVEAKRRDDLTQTDLVTDCVLQRWIVLLDDLDELVAVHRLGHLTLVRLTEAGSKHLSDVLLFHKVLIQLLDTGHLIVAVPIRCLQHLQFIHHLCIQLAIVDFARIVADGDCWW